MLQGVGHTKLCHRCSSKMSRDSATRPLMKHLPMLLLLQLALAGPATLANMQEEADGPAPAVTAPLAGTCNGDGGARPNPSIPPPPLYLPTIETL